ncbi:MAG: capsid protein [Cressdnaviricota sp.]|nr:MAG: capsid protein [Cressdnaviricota sp.]
MTYIRKKPAMKRRPYKRPYKRPTRKSARSSVVSIVKRQLAKSIEKKVADAVFSPIGTTIEFASTLGGNAGWVALDINPVINSGSGGNERVGNRVGITSGHLQLQLNGMSNQFRAIPYKIMIILRKNVSTSEAPNTTVKNFFTPNVFTGQIDSTSSYNVAMRSNYQILGTR